MKIKIGQRCKLSRNVEFGKPGADDILGSVVGTSSYIKDGEIYSGYLFELDDSDYILDNRLYIRVIPVHAKGLIPID